MSFNMGLSSSSKSRKRTGSEPEKPTDRAARKMKELKTKLTLTKKNHVKTEEKPLASKYREKISDLLAYLQLEKAEGTQICKLSKALARVASTTKQTHLFRDEVKRTAQSLSNEMKEIIRKNIYEKIDRARAKDGIVYLSDIFDACAFEETVMPPAPSIAPETEPYPRNLQEKDLLEAMMSRSGIIAATDALDEHLSAECGRKEKDMCDAAKIAVDRLLDCLDVRELVALDAIDMGPIPCDQISLRMLRKGLADHEVLVNLPKEDRLRIETEVFTPNL